MNPSTDDKKSCVLALSSVHAVEPAAERVGFWEDGVSVGPSREFADCPSGHAGRKGQRQRHAVPQQHQQGGWAATVQRIRCSV